MKDLLEKFIVHRPTTTVAEFRLLERFIEWARNTETREWERVKEWEIIMPDGEL